MYVLYGISKYLSISLSLSLYIYIYRNVGSIFSNLMRKHQEKIRIL